MSKISVGVRKMDPSNARRRPQTRFSKDKVNDEVQDFLNDNMAARWYDRVYKNCHNNITKLLKNNYFFVFIKIWQP